MKRLFAILLLVSLLIPAIAQDISPGYTPVDGQRLTAAQLLQLVNQATIQPSFLTSKAFQGAPAPGDLFLVYSASSGTFHKVTAASLLYTNFNLISSQVSYSTTIPAATFLFYDPTNQWMGQITEANLAKLVSSGVVVSNLDLYNTNGNQLPIYGTVVPNTTNNPLYVVVYDTNGIPSAITFSNLLYAWQSFQYTNWIVPLAYEQIFTPWLMYGTNGNFTNAWGTTTNWPIFSLFTNNAAGASTNVATLVDQDTIPVKSVQQGTNTTMSLLAFYQYLTNKNALPPFTIARVQFSGAHVTMTITNMSATTGIITNIANAAAWTLPTPVSFLGAASQMPTTAQVQSNTVYYAQLTNTTPIGFQLFTNIANANARTNYILGNGVTPSATGTLFWLTNFTSFACDAIQLSGTTSIRTGNYGIVFRSPAANNLYYITATLGNPDATGGIIEIQTQNAYDLQTTNGCVVASKSFANGYQEATTVHVLINPQ